MVTTRSGSPTHPDDAAAATPRAAVASTSGDCATRASAGGADAADKSHPTSPTHARMQQDDDEDNNNHHHHDDAGDGAAGADADASTLALGELECGVCLGLLCEPLTIPTCGHSLCRLCLVRACQRQKRCPICRAVCMINAEDHAETRLLTRLAKRAFPALYEQRLEETRQEREAMKLLLPVFFYNLPIFPGEVLRLHLFEPRYRVMMQRIVNSSRRFAYVPNYSNYQAQAGDVALVAELKEVNIMRDGRSELEARIVGRYTIMDSYVEEGTGGLSYCRLEELRDVPPATAEATQALQEASETAWEVAHTLFMARRDIKAVVVDRYGEMPGARSPEALSLWIAAVLPVESRQDKHALLVGTDTTQRLNTCLGKLQSLRTGGA